MTDYNDIEYGSTILCTIVPSNHVQDSVFFLALACFYFFSTMYYIKMPPSMDSITVIYQFVRR